MKNFKYTAYAVPCCMAIFGGFDGIALATITTMFLAFLFYTES